MLKLARCRFAHAMSGTVLQLDGPRWEPAAGLRLAVFAHQRCKAARSPTGPPARPRPPLDRGDAQLGTLAGSIKGCVAAVGPGAALAAAKPDGTLAAYQSPQEFLAGGMQTRCPITIVDAGLLSDQIITELANRKDITLIVTGVGPNAGSDDPSLQVVYRLGTTLPGWLTSASTRREGIVTLTDLTRTLIEFGGPTSSVAVDGSPFAVYDADLSVERDRRQDQIHRRTLQRNADRLSSHSAWRARRSS